jgi:hypothetical protein
MSDPEREPPSLEDALYILNHVFLPPKLPQEDDADRIRDVVLCRLVYDASLEFTQSLPEIQRPQWLIVTQMLDMFLETTRILDKKRLIEKILQMKDGGRFC